MQQITQTPRPTHRGNKDIRSRRTRRGARWGSQSTRDGQYHKESPTHAQLGRSRTGKVPRYQLTNRKQPFSQREEEDMFEAIFRVVVQVETDEQGQRVFPVTKQRPPVNESEFLSLLASVYQEEVYPTLRADDSLTVTAHLDLPPREVERTFRFREDRLFEG